MTMIARKFTRTLPFRLFVFSLCVAFFSFAPDSIRAQDAADAEKKTEPKTILCSTTQIADFTRQIVGDRCIVKCVLAAGEDPHTYVPGADDLADCANSDLCLRNGWNLEGNAWMKGMAEGSRKKLVTCIDGVKPRELEGSHGAEDGMIVKDPHAWFDPANALIYVNNIRDAVCELEPKHADEFRMRADLYRLQLLALNRWIRESLSKIKKNRRILITHHDAFGYFSEKYGFVAESPVGWTTGELTELSLPDRQALVKYIRERGVPAIFVETSTNQDLLKGIAKEAGITIGEPLYSDAMGPEDSAGETYIGMMRENVLRIVSALGGDDSDE
jgi:manganese/iron transport system substrate-binding protein